MKLTPAQVKNLMRRGLRVLVDPEPGKDDKQRVWDFFGDSCAYCGMQLRKGEGDIDHLVSAALGGTNALANRVLSCKSCNAEEKRDRDWIEFLSEKCATSSSLEERKSRIWEWIELNGGHPELSPEIRALLDEEAARTTKEYDIACERIRKRKQANEQAYPVYQKEAAAQGRTEASPERSAIAGCIYSRSTRSRIE
jgi:hypothetical protein